MEEQFVNEKLKLRMSPGNRSDVPAVSLGSAENALSFDETASRPQSADPWRSEFSDQLADWTMLKPGNADLSPANELTNTLDSAYDRQMEKRSRPWDFQDDEQVIVGLWPYGNTNPGVGDEAKVSKGKIESIVTVFAIVWIGIVFWRQIGSSFNLIVNLYSIIPLLVLPLFTMVRGSTHLRFDQFGLEFASLNAATSKVRKRLVWRQIEKVYLDGKTKPTVLDQSLCFKHRDGTTHSVKLKQIANRGQWQKILEALDRWCPVSIEELDRNVFGAAAQDRTSPTYTMLWLEALAAPPRRERLTPMTEGTPLCKGRYVLERKLGAGGQGSAFLASSTTDASKVVLKEYILPIYVDMKARKQALERFEHEAKLLAALDHPSIVKLLDYFVDDHRAYLVLEYIDGDNLQQVVENDGPMPESIVLNCANALVDILSYLHSQTPPVVHRDFTPDNLIASKDGTIKLIDFMVAQQSDMVQQQSASSTVVGKHAYMAPEQFRGQNRTQSDIYALGCTLYFLLTGKEPEPITQLHPILENEHCPLILNEIVAKCTEADYVDRYQSVDEIKTELARATRSDL